MGSNRIPDRTNGEVIDDSWFNRVQGAICTDVVPRSAAGVATTFIGTLGEAALQWLRGYFTVGEWECGDIKEHHSFNGLVGPGQGWMLMDGRIVSQANYDTEHGAGSWATYIGSSPLNGKLMPDCASVYIVGAIATTQDGSLTMSNVGAVGHFISWSHAHQWYKIGSPSFNKYFDSSGAAVDMPASVVKTFTSDEYGLLRGPGKDLLLDRYTVGFGSVHLSIQPDSIISQYYMRII